MGHKEALKVSKEYGNRTKDYVTQEQLDDVLVAFGEIGQPDKLTCDSLGLIDNAVTFPKDTEIVNTCKKEVLEGSKVHWDVIVESAKKGTLREDDIQSTECACCQVYCVDPKRDCVGCPLKGKGRYMNAWCCDGKWKVVHRLIAVSSEPRDNLTTACLAVRDYIKKKLDELDPEFGVEDIVYYEGGHGNAFCRIGEISGQFHYCYTIEGKGPHGAFLAPALKLIFPISRILKKRGGIYCEPKGDIVELDNGVVGMVCGFGCGGGFVLLTWERNDFWIRASNKDYLKIKRTIWRCDGINERKQKDN